MPGRKKRFIDIMISRVSQKASYYTQFFFYPDGLNLAYNSLTNATLKIEGKEGEKIRAYMLKGRHSKERKTREVQALTKMGFLIDEDINEINVVKELFRMGKRISGTAMITILPTLECNFKCPYCFEKHTKGFMSADVQDALLSFITRRLIKHQRSISIGWFGGEPLLGVSVMESLSKRIKDACEKKKVNVLPSHIVTNGYLLTPKTLKRLLAIGITSAQVTIDGPEKIHDSRRCRTDGKGSFAIIMKNLKNIPDDFTVNIRVNIDKDNKDSVFELMQILNAQKIMPKIKTYIANVEEFGEKCSPSEGRLLTSAEFARFSIELQKQCRQANIPWFSNSSPSLMAYRYCIVDQPVGFVVQPDGNILKCWGEAGGNPDNKIGHLLKEETWNNMSSSKLQSRDPFDDKECWKCKILPLCMGGCPKIREITRNAGTKYCPSIRYSLSEEVRMMHEQNN